jgi:hypothetical protein
LRPAAANNRVAAILSGDRKAARLNPGEVEHIGERIETLPARQLDKVRRHVRNEGSGRPLREGTDSFCRYTFGRNCCHWKNLLHQL